MRHVVMLMVIACFAATTAFGAGPANTTTPAKTKASAPAKVAAPKAAAGVRTLDAIRIEGEIDVPQVLFITARDYRRFRDPAPAKYQITSADIAKSIPLPNRLRMVAPIE